VARLFKARYFPNSSFFYSKIGHNPSSLGGVFGKPGIFSCMVVGGVLAMGVA
jgi:hypothetical protein